MTGALTESMVEDTTVAQFGAVNVSTAGGAALDDAGERDGIASVLLAARAKIEKGDIPPN